MEAPISPSGPPESKFSQHLLLVTLDTGVQILIGKSNGLWYAAAGGSAAVSSYLIRIFRILRGRKSAQQDALPGHWTDDAICVQSFFSLVGLDRKYRIYAAVAIDRQVFPIRTLEAV